MFIWTGLIYVVTRYCKWVKLYYLHHSDYHLVDSFPGDTELKLNLGFGFPLLHYLCQKSHSSAGCYFLPLEYILLVILTDEYLLIGYPKVCVG